ncbi:MAG: HEAT repeat domain-containing protein [Candidatus Wallbacteria bacterium]|nr:HEAT repeat domain-containing protein [Candidatus Wallbacteria bacterium]
MPFEVLIRQLDDEDEDVRQNAAWIVGQLCVKDAAPILLKMLAADPEPLGRHVAAVALGRIRDPATLAELERVLKEDAEPLARIGCAIGLGLMRDSAALPALKAAAEAPENHPLRDHISEAIRLIGSVQHKHRSALEKKIEKSKREVAENPDDGAAHNNLGVAYYHNRQYELAIQHCDRAKSLGAGVAWLEERLKPQRKPAGNKP